MNMADDKIPSRYNWKFGFGFNDVITKEELIRSYSFKLLTILTQMFKIDGLPETIPERDAKIILLTHGSGTYKKLPDSVENHAGEEYMFSTGLGGKPNPYYLPTLAIINNPALNYNAQLKIDEECVVIRNTPFYESVLPLVERYATMLAENYLSLKMAVINSRIPRVLYADNDTAKKDMKNFLKKIMEGTEIGVVGGNPFFEGIKSVEYNNQNNNTIKELIESTQYTMASFFIEVGIESNYNMKRESLNDSETKMNEDSLMPLCDSMLEMWQEGFGKVNKMYERNIKVDFSSAWKKMRDEFKLSKELQEKTIEQMDKVEEKKEGEQDESAKEDN